MTIGQWLIIMPFIDYFLQPKTPGKTAPEKQITTIKDIIAPSGMKIQSNYIQIGEKYARTLFVFTYPRQLATNWFSPIITLDKEMNIAMFIHPADTAVILKNLRKKAAQIESQIGMRQEQGHVRDPLLETAQQDIESLRDILQQGTERFFEFGLYITFFASSEKGLDEIETQIRSLLETKMVYAKPATFQHEEGFFSTLPLEQDRLSIHYPLNSSPLASVFPFVSMDLIDNKGVLYGINGHNNSLILFDRFALENYNMVVFAKAGAGKSYFVKLEVLRSLMLGTEVIIIDPEKEYKYLTEAVGGSFIDISLSSANHLNPFDLPIPREDESPEDLLRNNIINLVGLMRIMLGGLTPAEDAIIDRALRETYALRDITPQSDFSKITPPLMSDLQSVLENMEGGKDLAIRLEKHTKGSFAGFFNSPTNVALRNKLVVFSIRDLEEELRPMAMYIILHYIWNIVRSEMKKRILVVDEAWWLMQHKEGASFLFGIAKRCRKYYLGLTTITQDVSDFLNSDYGKPIIKNSSMQLLMKQSATDIDVLQKAFALTDEEKNYLVEGSAVGQGIFFAGLKHVAIQVVASYTEDQLITTDPRQILEREKNITSN
jgi:type IV secretory pathway VirB4 component